MKLFSLIRSGLSHRVHARNQAGHSSVGRRPFRPRFEMLEDRYVLSTFTVTDNSDVATDTGSLRFAVNHAGNGDAIIFNPTLTGGNTIDLVGSPLTITQNNLAIDGTGSGPITVDGQSTIRVFVVTGTGNTITALTIAHGSATGFTVDGDGGGIAIDPEGSNLEASLAVTNCTFTSNSANDGSAIYNNGTLLTVTTCTFTDNSASDKGAIFNEINDATIVTVTGSTFTNNSATRNGGAIYNNADKPPDDYQLRLHQ